MKPEELMGFQRLLQRMGSNMGELQQKTGTTKPDKWGIIVPPTTIPTMNGSTLGCSQTLKRPPWSTQSASQGILCFIGLDPYQGLSENSDEKTPFHNLPTARHQGSYQVGLKMA
jgi:hypothetical protein